MSTSINDASIYDDNFTLLQKYKALERRITALENSSGGGSSYTLPTASETTKGGIKIGDNLYMSGEFLNAISGGSSSGGYMSYTGMGTINSPIEDSSILLGFVDRAEVTLKDYTTPITYTNESDSTDTISVYLKNSSAGYDSSDRDAYISGEDFGYIPMIKNPNSGELLPVYGDFIYCYGLSMLTFYDTASQENAEPIWQTNAQPLQQRGRISKDYNADEQYYLQDAYGYIDFSDYPIYIGDKTYTSQDSIQLSSIVGTASGAGSGGDVALNGTWLKQQSI